MKAAALSFMFPLALLLALNTAWARDSVLPAGTLVTCTLDEPNFSSATASVGDPVLCHPHGLQVFGQTVFPRGTYIVGHLADDKDPGHFWGKGFLKLEFDRIGLPGTDLPLSAKMIAVSGGYRVDKEGKIIGKGHAKRDIVEWMLPPLWPWKILTLANRGPRPRLKGETRVTLRLMEDVIVPDSAQWQRFGRLDSGGSFARPALYLRPRSMPTPSGFAAPAYRTISYQPQTTSAPARGDSSSVATASDHSGWKRFRKTARAAASSQPDPAPAINEAETKAAEADDGAMTSQPSATDNASAKESATDSTPAKAVVPENPLAAATPVAAAAPAVTADSAALVKTLDTEKSPISAVATVPMQKAKVTLFALRAGTVYVATDYWRDEDRLVYVTPNGKEAQTDMSDLDWKTTTQLNAERGVKVTLREGR